jgi:Icc-related predicted phosphoesterase
MRVVAVSDIHCKWSKVTIPDCDLLISCGDYSFTGEPWVVKDFHKWLNKQPAKYKLSVQGNHEKWVEHNFQEAKKIAEEACPGVFFMEEGLVEIEGLKIWCSAITLFFRDWAYNRYPGEEIQEHWDKIPQGIDILVTHGPAYGILDGVPEGENMRHLGCPQLLKKIEELKPKFHICGHIHEGRGMFKTEHTTFINASICDGDYKPVNLPMEFEI